MIRFRTSFRIAPGLRVNLGKRGVTSVRIGPRGLGVTVGKRGTRVGGALPGPFSWSHRLGTPPTARPGSATGTGTKLFAVPVVALLAGLVLLAAAHAASANVNIVDGDTLKIDRVTIRIVEIDTPETCQFTLRERAQARPRRKNAAKGTHRQRPGPLRADRHRPLQADPGPGLCRRHQCRRDAAERRPRAALSGRRQSQA